MNTETMDAVPPCVLACLPDASRSSARYLGITNSQANSDIHKVMVGDQALCIKHCYKPGTKTPNPVVAQHQFTALRQICHAAKAAGIPPLTPAPFVLSLDHASYSMEWAEGQSMTEALCDKALTHEAALRIGKDAGVWLCHFHALAPAANGTDDFLQRMPYVYKWATARPNDELMHRCAYILRDSGDEAAATEVPVSWLHGDMKSDNLLIGRGTPLGFDMAIEDNGIVAWDVAAFLNHLALLSHDPRYLLNRKKFIAAADAFLNGYCPENRDWSLPLLWIQLYLLIQRITKDPKNLRQRVENLVVRRVLRELSEKLYALQYCR